MTKSYFNIKELCVIGLTAAILCVLAPYSVPTPFRVPITLQTFFITLIAIILGAKPAMTATLIYILLGAFGLPVFSNFTGGWQVLTGPTGGFLLSFPLMAYCIGLGSSHRQKRKGNLLLGILLGNLLNFICGIAIFCLITKSRITVGITTCVLPFLPFDIIKTALACFIGLQVKRRIRL